MIFINKGRKIDTDGIKGRLNQVMREKKLSQYDVATMTGIGRAMIGHLSTGDRGFSLEIAGKICKGLDIDFIWFITGVKIK
jgi:transcriptional regulator with XRE-family HTH domain